VGGESTERLRVLADGKYATEISTSTARLEAVKAAVNHLREVSCMIVEWWGEGDVSVSSLF
jgi:hypothetical protein